MKKSRPLGAVCVLVMLLTFSFQANASIIDQNQPSTNVPMAGFDQVDLAQSFQQSSDSITGAGIFLDEGFGTLGTVTISLWDALPNDSGNLLATGTAVGTSGSWLDVFWSSVAVTPDTTLFLVFTALDDPLNDPLAIAGDTGNPYDRGQVYANSGYGSFSAYDYTFRTYSASAAVPIPAAVWLFGSGLLGLVGMARRKKA